MVYLSNFNYEIMETDDSNIIINVANFVVIVLMVVGISFCHYHGNLQFMDLLILFIKNIVGKSYQQVKLTFGGCISRNRDFF